jgi:hypothetical protein
METRPNDTVKEHITREPSDEDAWVCICKNTPVDDGFYPCDEKGNEMEPTIGSGWTDLYVCARCGRIIKQDTLEVVGVNPNPKMLD